MQRLANRGPSEMFPCVPHSLGRRQGGYEPFRHRPPTLRETAEKPRNRQETHWKTPDTIRESVIFAFR